MSTSIILHTLNMCSSLCENCISLKLLKQKKSKTTTKTVVQEFSESYTNQAGKNKNHIMHTLKIIISGFPHEFIINKNLIVLKNSIVMNRCGE